MRAMNEKQPERKTSSLVPPGHVLIGGFVCGPGGCEEIVGPIFPKDDEEEK